MSRLVFTGLCLVLLFTQWAFAGVHFWAYSMMSLALYTLFMLWTAHCMLLTLGQGHQDWFRELGVQIPGCDLSSPLFMPGRRTAYPIAPFLC
jgi:hypothetical protein